MAVQGRGPRPTAIYACERNSNSGSTKQLATYTAYYVVGGVLLLLSAWPHAANYFDHHNYPRVYAGIGGQPLRGTHQKSLQTTARNGPA